MVVVFLEIKEMNINIKRLQKILCEQTNLDIKLIECHKDFICIDTDISFTNGDVCSIYIKQIDKDTFRIVDDSNCILKILPHGFEIHENKIHFDTNIDTLGTNLLRFINIISSGVE